MSYDVCLTWLKTMWAKFLAYIGRGGSDDQGQP